ncbi:hypothetical protein ACIBBE_24260 [Streptomyces sp. NPDC051644]|uniref:hypothetical protein n=1 Tax=Streptomyces sp. NPDC051644 TaxID=3365666 RepID=UPI0037908147
MHTSHAHTLEAARYAALAREDHAAGELRPLPNYALSAISACCRAQMAADVPDTTADLIAVLDSYKSPEELLREAEQKARSEQEYEEQQRAATDMDAPNRAKRYRDVGTATQVIPQLGWSRQMVQAVEYADDGRLWLDSNGTARLINRAGVPGRVVASSRIRLLRQAGYLRSENDSEAHLLVTPEARRALYLADLHPEGIHRDDRAAHAARLKVALTRRRGKQNARNEAARLPRMDVWAMRHADDLPATLTQQREVIEEQRRTEEEKATEKVCTDSIEEFAGRIADHLDDGWALNFEQNPYYLDVRYLYLVHTDGRKLRVKGENCGRDEQGAALPAEKLKVWAILPDTDRPIRSDE